MICMLSLLISDYILYSCRREILNNPSKRAIKDAQREKFTACVKGTRSSKYLKMEYFIRPSKIVPNVDTNYQICKRTFMATWGITENTMKVCNNPLHISFLWVYLMLLL